MSLFRLYKTCWQHVKMCVFCQQFSACPNFWYFQLSCEAAETKERLLQQEVEPSYREVGQAVQSQAKWTHTTFQRAPSHVKPCQADLNKYQPMAANQSYTTNLTCRVLSWKNPSQANQNWPKRVLRQDKEGRPGQAEPICTVGIWVKQRIVMPRAVGWEASTTASNEVAGSVVCIGSSSSRSDVVIYFFSFIVVAVVVFAVAAVVDDKIVIVAIFVVCFVVDFIIHCHLYNLLMLVPKPFCIHEWRRGRTYSE